MKRYCLALDLKDDPDLIEEYKKYHRTVWPEIEQSIRSSGIVDMQIYLAGNRLFMVMETDDRFSFEAKAAADAANPVVQQWEELMWKFQQALPQAKPGEKWILMKQIFSLAAGNDGSDQSPADGTARVWVERNPCANIQEA